MRRTIATLYAGAEDDDMDQIAASVGDNIAFASVQFLTRIINPKRATFRCFDRLTFKNTPVAAGSSLSYATRAS